MIRSSELLPDQRKSKRMATQDHMLPRCRGGSKKYNNIVLACDCCNRKKGSRTVEEFLTALAKWIERKRIQAAIFNQNFLLTSLNKDNST